MPGNEPSPTNPYADDLAAAEFGHELFFDPGLSVNGSISCATCHRPKLHFTDGRRTAEGLGVLSRNTPTVVGLSAAPFLMWDGRKDSLWSQAMAPLLGEPEMGSTPASLARHVRENHAEDYLRVFDDKGSLPSDDLEVCLDVARALESYQRRLELQPAPFDRFVSALLAGDPEGGRHMSRLAVRGLRAFIGPGGCVGCHSGPLMTDFSFHAIGLPPGAASKDLGRAAGIRALLADSFRADGAHSSDPSDRGYTYFDAEYEHHVGAFKTPSLRNVAATAPYGHAGQLETLEEMVEFYRKAALNAQGRHVDPLLGRISPELDVQALVAFLEALSSPPPDDRWHRDPFDP